MIGPVQSLQSPVRSDRLTFTLFESRLGWMAVVRSAEGLKRVILPQTSKDAVLAQIGACGIATEDEGSARSDDLPDRLRRFIDGEPVDFPDSLDMSGTTSFRQKVWQSTRRIPYGEVKSYLWVARQIGSPKGARAVGQALGENPYPIVVPCHRVSQSDGGLGGFGGGLKLKRFLLG